MGLDPDPARLWPRALELAGGVGAPPDVRAASAVQVHCQLAIDAAGEHCVAVKPQIACFERLGAPGWAALRAVTEYAHQQGLLVIADGKRGDIDVSAAAYAQAYFGETPTAFGPVPGLGADGLTVNPLLGLDSLLAMVQMPAGIPVATVAIGKPGATNAGILAAQMIGLHDHEVAKKLEAHKEKLAKGVEAKSKKLQESQRHAEESGTDFFRGPD